MLIGTVKSFITDESGATAIEYGLIASLIAVALISTTTILGNSLIDLFNNGATEVLDAQAAKIS